MPSHMKPNSYQIMPTYEESYAGLNPCFYSTPATAADK